MSRNVTQTTMPDPQTMRMREILWNATLQGLGANLGMGGGAPGMAAGGSLPPASSSNPWHRILNRSMTRPGSPLNLSSPVLSSDPNQALFPNDRLVRTAGMDPRFEAAATATGQLTDLGLGAAQGVFDPSRFGATVGQYMDPYQRQVIDAARAEFGATRANTMAGINANATAAGAFGGSRHGAAQGVALGELGRAENSAIAGLLSQGYESAAGRAMQAGMLGANLGLGGANQLGAMGDAFRQLQQQRYDEDLRRLGVISGAITGAPQGSTSSMPVYRNPLGSALGGAASGFAIGGPVGAGIGAGVGLLGSFF